MNSRLVKQSLLAATLITITANIVGRFLGLVRESVTANLFGTSAAFDVFVLAFTIPELLAFVIYSALPTALTPYLNSSLPPETDSRRSSEEGRLFWSGLAAFTVILGGMTGLVYVFRAEIFHAMAPVLSEDQMETGINLLAISSLVVPLRGLEAFFRGCLFTRKHFVGPVFTSLFLNAAVMAVVVLLHGRLEVYSLAWGWVCGALVALLYNGAVAVAIIRPRWSLRWPTGRLGVLVWLTLATAGVETISLAYPLVDRVLAARFLSEGQIAALRYATSLSQVVPGMLVATYSAASFPWVSELSAGNAGERLQKLYEDSVRMIVFAIAFVTVIAFPLSHELVRIAFERGAFDSQSALLTQGPFRWYVLGLVFYSVYIYQMRFYYARKAMLRLGVVLLAMLGVKILCSMWLVGPLGHEGLAIATACTWVFGLAVMTVDLSRWAGLSLVPLARSLIPRLTVPLALSVTLLLVVTHAWSPPEGSSLFTVLAHLSVVSALVLTVYLGGARMVGMHEPAALVSTILSRLNWNRGNHA